MPAHVRNRTNLLPLQTIPKNIRTKVLASREGLRRHHEAHALIRPRDDGRRHGHPLRPGVLAEDVPRERLEGARAARHGRRADGEVVVAAHLPGRGGLEDTVTRRLEVRSAGEPIFTPTSFSNFLRTFLKPGANRRTLFSETT